MRLLILSLLFALPVCAQNQSLSLPLAVPVHCAPKQNIPCVFRGALAGRTGIIVGRETIGALTDTLGDTWTKDVTVPFNGNSIYHTNFTIAYPSPTAITFQPGEGDDVWMFVYDGSWKFDVGITNSYAGQAQIPPDCMSISGQPVGDCPYNWTLPIAADAGELLIAWADNNATGLLLAKPGPGWWLEASDGKFAVEDMFAPVEGPYIGALTWKFSDGTNTGGSHWLMGLAAFRRIG